MADTQNEHEVPPALVRRGAELGSQIALLVETQQRKKKQIKDLAESAIWRKHRIDELRAELAGVTFAAAVYSGRSVEEAMSVHFEDLLPRTEPVDREIIDIATLAEEFVVEVVEAPVEPFIAAADPDPAPVVTPAEDTSDPAEVVYEVIKRMGPCHADSLRGKIPQEITRNLGPIFSKLARAKRIERDHADRWVVAA
jgi:hypothetical protein